MSQLLMLFNLLGYFNFREEALEKKQTVTNTHTHTREMGGSDQWCQYLGVVLGG